MNLSVVGKNLDVNSLPVVHVIVVGEQNIHTILSQDPLFNVYPECLSYERFMQLATTKQIQLNKFIVVVSDSLSEKVVNFQSVISLVKERAVVIAWNLTEEQKVNLGLAHILEAPTANSLRGYIAHRAGIPEVPVLPEDAEVSPPRGGDVVNLSKTESLDSTPSNLVNPGSEKVSQIQADTEVVIQEPEHLTRKEKRLLREQKVKEKNTDFPVMTQPVKSVETTFDLSPGANSLHQNSTKVVQSAPANEVPVEVAPVTVPRPVVESNFQLPKEQIPNFRLSESQNIKVEDSYEPQYTNEVSKGQHGLEAPLVVAIYSPKGGVGKTSISVNMASRLAFTTKLQICVVDIDIGFGNVGTRLGLFTPTMRELLSEPDVDSDALARHLAYDRRSGLYALLAPLRPESGVNRNVFSPFAFTKVLGLLKERFDVIILDCPVELRDPIVSHFAIPQSDKIVMVINNEQATLLDARRAIEAIIRSVDNQRLPGLGIPIERLGIIINQKVDNVGRELEDIKNVISGGDPAHPVNSVDILSVIPDDRELWVGSANLARPVASDGNSIVEQRIDEVLRKIIPEPEVDYKEVSNQKIGMIQSDDDAKRASIFDKIMKRDD